MKSRCDHPLENVRGRLNVDDAILRAAWSEARLPFVARRQSSNPKDDDVGARHKHTILAGFRAA